MDSFLNVHALATSMALTRKQRAQRKYAGKMRGVRKRATKTRRGKGRIKKRPAARKLRKRLGLRG